MQATKIMPPTATEGKYIVILSDMTFDEMIALMAMMSGVAFSEKIPQRKQLAQAIVSVLEKGGTASM